MSNAIKTKFSLELCLNNLEYRYDQGDSYITIRGSDLESTLFLELDDLASLVEFKKAIDDLA